MESSKSTLAQQKKSANFDAVIGPIPVIDIRPATTLLPNHK